MDNFANSLEHLLAELERIDLLIQVQVDKLRKLQNEDEQFRGLYISELELDSLLKQSIGRPRWHLENYLGKPEAAIAQIKQELDRRKNLTRCQGVELRLETLQNTFQLNDYELDVVLICLAIELDIRYERLYAYLQDDVTKKKPNVDLVLSLLHSGGAEKISGMQSFYAEAPLLKHNLITFSSDPAYSDPPLPAKFLKLNARISQFLLGSDDLDDRIRSAAVLIKPESSKFPDEYQLDLSLMERFSMLIASGWGGGGAVIHLAGAYTVGKQGIAETLCLQAGLNLLKVDIDSLLANKDAGLGNVLRLIIREAMLQRAAIYWLNFDNLLDQPVKSQLSVFIRCWQDCPTMLFLAGNLAWQPPCEMRNTPYLRIELPKSTFADRAKMWAMALSGELSAHTEVDIATFAGKFKFTGGQIQDAAVTAKNLAVWEDAKTGKITAKHLYEACRLHSNQKLSALARKISPKYRWDDIVLPLDRTAQLREICNHIKYRDRVYTDWGFDKKLAMGKGLCVLFAGPSGTGKTMAADIIAGELGLDLYKIDLSTVVSKYIGETEKNLAKLFSEAETSNAILFFDEADALFGKRSEVKDSHDRYANIETGYLLQRMEEHEGMVILATNFRKNMDEAFVRRLHITVEFPFPNEEDRRRIWEGVWPTATPRDPALDLGYLAGRFQITGGNIRNIALSAAFLAADDNGIVNMRHLLLATQREYQKMGKVVSELDYGLQSKGLNIIGGN
ncbi:MAG: ATP-binding protein [Methylococcaceae bacterium]|nr:ATP-binding protein [Methylococcaceae bacterium]